jgi:hypothetical protein
MGQNKLIYEHKEKISGSRTLFYFVTVTCVVFDGPLPTLLNGCDNEI